MLDAFHISLDFPGAAYSQVTVTGELDMATAPVLRHALHVAIAACSRVTVDLSALRFCDCTGLSALLGAARIAEAADVDLRLRAVPSCLTTLLRLTCTHAAFTIESGVLSPGPW